MRRRGILINHIIHTSNYMRKKMTILIRHSRVKRFMLIVIIILILNTAISIIATVLFDKKGYCLTKNEILSYEDIFFDFCGVDGIHYSYTNFSDTVYCSFNDIKPILKSTEYKALGKYEGRFLALFQNGLTSAGKIDIIVDDVDSKETVNFENNIISNRICYARIFKLMNKYYIYYYPKTKAMFSSFAVCEILNSSKFLESDIVNAKADRYTYPYIYPSFLQNLLYSRFTKLMVIVVFIGEVLLLYLILKKKITVKQYI